MGVLAENGAVHEITSGSSSNLAYVLHDNRDFSLTEYKVLQSQSNRGFLKCMQMLYNGRIELYYLTTGYRTFDSMFPLLDGTAFITIVTNLLNAIIEVKNNGFLSYQNIDISFDKIFVDPSNLSVGLIYVPINIHALTSFTVFETELRMNLVKLINHLPSLSAQKTSKFYIELSNGGLPLEALLSKTIGITAQQNTELLDKGRSVMSLEALNVPISLELKVDKEVYVIGKDGSEVDGVVAFNSAISRVHCKIRQTGGGYLLEDLGSLNGTYLNKVRLMPHAPTAVSNGDIIQLANSDFQVRIR